MLLLGRTVEHTMMTKSRVPERLRSLVSCISALSVTFCICAARAGAEECDQPAQVKVADGNRVLCASEAPEFISARTPADKIIVGSLQRQASSPGASPTTVVRALERVQMLKLRLKLALAQRTAKVLRRVSSIALGEPMSAHIRNPQKLAGADK